MTIRAKRPVRRLLAALALLLCIVPAARAADDATVRERRVLHLLIRDLGDRKHGVRLEAERKLKRMGKRAIPDLALAVDGRHVAVSTMPADKQEIARARAASALGALGGERAQKHLVRALGSRSRLVRRAAINALGEMRSKEAVPLLVKLASGDDSVAACDAILALGAIADKSAVKEVLALLTEQKALKERLKDDADVARLRGAAAFALGMIGDTAAVPALLAALRDASVGVRRHANLALRQMSGRDLHFKADAPAAARKRVAKAWDAWWRAKLK